MEIHGNLRISAGPDALRISPLAGRVDTALESTIALFADLTVRLNISLDDSALLVRFIGAPNEGSGPFARAVASALQRPQQLNAGARVVVPAVAGRRCQHPRSDDRGPLVVMVPSQTRM